MDQDWEYAVDEELSPWADVGGQELCLWEEVRGSVGAEQESEEGALAGELELPHCNNEEEPELSGRETNQY